ncbi:MAG TPA: hypothetical protein VFH08_10800 [Chitinophagaceae bacterium]|nr:hypothetical protein [Chitinophagaceae bacterium]
MKLQTLSAIVFLSSILTTTNSQNIIPFSDKRWKVVGQGQMTEFYKGYECIYLRGARATLPDVQFLNGIIEFDMCLTEQTAFAGLFFRQTDPGNYEEFYFRAHQSGRPDSYQYTPVFNNDPAWQLYHDQFDAVNDGYIHWKPRGELNGFNGVIEYPFERWVHVKLLVKNDKAELYYDNNPEPAAVIRKLLQEQKPGAIGVYCNVSAMRFANFSYTQTNDVVLKKNEAALNIIPANSIRTWEVSNPFKEDVLKDKNLLDAAFVNKLKWTKLAIENGGFANLARLSTVTDSNTVLTKITVVSDKDQVKKLEFGYSDRVKAFCNGQAIYSGNNNFRTRDYRYLGTIGYFDALYLPLKKGDNTVILAVSETFGGWGVMAKWENMDGIRVKE